MPHIHAPGLVLRFDPQALADNGATFAGGDDIELNGPQYFVCVEANPKDALWLPLFAGPAPGRKGIAATAKTGHLTWTKHSSFYHSGQLCRVAHKAATKASEAGRDMSTPKTPNRLAVAQIPPRAELPADEKFRPMAGNVAIR
jgi:hypothetical protein